MWMGARTRTHELIGANRSLGTYTSSATPLGPCCPPTEPLASNPAVSASLIAQLLCTQSLASARALGIAGEADGVGLHKTRSRISMELTKH